MGSEVGPRALRITVKDKEANERIVATLESVLSVRSSHSGLTKPRMIVF
jgi:histidinol-phosphate/aromatic aminotransferase/cobyric acid decarboxylase-like protein